MRRISATIAVASARLLGPTRFSDSDHADVLAMIASTATAADRTTPVLRI
jgi:hypothetical protein